MGADPRQHDDQQFSVLHAAASMGHVAVVQVPPPRAVGQRWKTLRIESNRIAWTRRGGD
jgi:hypothetical protein